MTRMLESVITTDELPESTEVVIIGGGIVGVSAALALAERNIPVVLLEKGHIGCEQSSRNLGWIRKTSRHAEDVPLAQAADRIWATMPERVGRDVGYRQNGIMFLAPNEAALAVHANWLKSVESLSLGSRLLSQAEIDRKIPGGKGKWAGAVYTASDGYAEAAQAAPAIANAAMRKGAVLVQGCAVRMLATSAGKVSGVITEKGEIRCKQVLLAGGAWSRRFLGNHGVELPTLPLICTVLRTTPMQGPTDIAAGGPDFSFRKHQDGGFIITQRGGLDCPIVPDHLRIGMKYLDQLGPNRKMLRIQLGKPFLQDLKLARRWKATDITPFEQMRVRDPAANNGLNQEALTNLRNAWPMFEQAQIAEAWAGWIDITPDSIPVIDHVRSIPGLTIATGFSGHGFGTGPAAGQLAADLVCGGPTIVDPAPYRFDRF
ncbi:NAD(P)/FAD-dependent oxidoreductase [Parathalassolituus penaei]|uniref:FAD-binding oxidoreductase n=1 Tax=Parathalassolituus penaei TaxID=2997323 RepID=A0A9X3EAI5_9GAMM|nr:FAD-binding oxidoreductase [Parathalassolituus penaei]MCY0963963.1 FAD-binding oxidoreductase [Parathalassolituus penaei]